MVKQFNFRDFLHFIIVFCTLSIEINSQTAKSFLIDQFKTISTQQGLSQSSVFCMAQDHNGYIWLGTRDGLNKFDGYNFEVFKYDPLDSTSLSNNEITTLHVDINGLLWIGTRGGGLNLYDGIDNTFKSFVNLKKENIIRDIYELGENHFLIASSYGLLDTKYKPESKSLEYINLFENVTIVEENGNTISTNKNINTAIALCSINKDSLLIGTQGGLLLYTHSNKRMLRFNKISQNSINTIYSNQKNQYWVGTYEGLYLLSFGKELTIKEYNVNQPLPYRLLVSRIETVISDKQNNTWIGSRGGGMARISSDGSIQHFTNNPSLQGSIDDNIVNSLMIDSTGLLWIGTESNGCNTLDLNKKKFYHLGHVPNEVNSLSNNLVTSITGNNNSTIWIGTAVKGIDKVEFMSDGNYKVTNIGSIPDLTIRQNINEIFALHADSKQNLWIGTASNAIYSYNEKRGFSHYLVNGFVFNIYEDKAGRIWFGTWGGGLGTINETTGNIQTFSNIAGNNHSLSSDKVLSVFNDCSGNLWVGTKAGGVNVARLDEIVDNKPQFYSFRQNSNQKNSLSHNDVYCIYEDKNKQIWIGTGGGLNKVETPDKLNMFEAIATNKIKFKVYLERDGLPNSVIYGILEDNQNNLWLSTNKGLSKFDSKKEIFKNYGDNSNLQVQEYHANAYFVDKNGVMFFGGNNGLTYFHPDSIKNRPFTSKVIITGLKIFNKNIVPGEELNGKIILSKNISNTRTINLSWREKEVTLLFSAMHFANPDKIQYKYRLMGFNPKWQITDGSSRSATYTNLSQGEYVFQVMATNDDDIWSKNIAQLQIIVKPPFWRTFWAYLLYGLIIVLALIVFKRYSLIAVKEKNKLLIEHIEHKKQTEVTEAKMRFFTNVSHEIRTPLTLIHDPVEQVLSEGALDDTSKTLLKLVSRNVSRLLDQVNQLLQFQKIDMGAVTPNYLFIALPDFVGDIASHFQQFTLSKNIEIKIQTLVPHLSVMADKDQLRTVIFNLLSNACKHAPQNGLVQVRLFKKIKKFQQKQGIFNLKNIFVKPSEWVVIEVSDNGKGIPQRELKKIFNRFYQVDSPENAQYSGSGIGLSMVSEYIELHKGHIEVKSKLKEGSAFYVYLPVIDGLVKPNLQIDGTFNKFNKSDVLPLDSLPYNTMTEKDSLPLILIVEDDTDLANYMAFHLSRTYRVRYASNGMMGKRMAFELIPDLIVSDVMMPEMDGIELCNILKDDLRTSHIPIILLTAKATPENMSEGLSSGAEAYIVKPFSIGVLDKQVQTLIDTRIILREQFKRDVLMMPTDVSFTSSDEKFLNRLLEVTEKHLHEIEFDVPSLVDKMNMSHSVIFRKVKALTGLTLVDYIKSIRLKRAAQILNREKLPVSEVCFMTGFNDPKYFSKCFQREFGVSPSQYGQSNEK